MSVAQLKKDLLAEVKPGKKAALERFFKTGKGQYGEGDVFLGVMVPEQRKVAKKYSELSLKGIKTLLYSKIHEHRLVSLFILIDKYKRSDEKGKKEIYNFYLKNTKQVNNWDLVDLSAHKIVGDYLLDKDRKILYKLVKSKNLWERRISIISTFAFTDKKDFKDAIKICEILLKDKHDLIHKATGWVLREIGKKDQKVLEGFLKKYNKVMPRTMLRYSIERLSEAKRKFYMKK